MADISIQSGEPLFPPRLRRGAVRLAAVKPGGVAVVGVNQAAQKQASLQPGQQTPKSRGIGRFVLNGLAMLGQQLRQTAVGIQFALVVSKPRERGVLPILLIFSHFGRQVAKPKVVSINRNGRLDLSDRSKMRYSSIDVVGIQSAALAGAKYVLVVGINLP
jgi:hypothetical protein